MRTEEPATIVFYTTLMWVPMSLIPALLVWHWPQGIVWLWLMVCGVFGTVAHMWWTRALQLGDASMLTPISFMQLLVVGDRGCWLFGERVDRCTLLGTSIIFASTVYIAHRETRLAKPTITDPLIQSETQQR